MLVRGKYILTSAYPEEIREGAFRITDGIISEIGKSFLDTAKEWLEKN